jgi:hypothetical protein
MHHATYAIYILGAAFVCGVLSLVVANRMPGGIGIAVQALAVVGGGYYGYRQAKKNQAPPLP